MKDSPASINDIQKGDIITSINNQIIKLDELKNKFENNFFNYINN